MAINLSIKFPGFEKYYRNGCNNSNLSWSEKDQVEKGM